MQRIQTWELPPNHGVITFPMKGCKKNSRKAPRNETHLWFMALIVSSLPSGPEGSA